MVLVRALERPTVGQGQFSFSREFIDPELLTVNSNLGRTPLEVAFQRPLYIPRVRGMVENWQYALCMPVSVSLRESGLYVVVDGQHRVAAALKLRLPELECRVYRSLSPQDEARLFGLLNTGSKAVSPGELFRASLEAGDDTALAVTNICKEYGFTIDYFSSLTPTNFRCIQTVLSLYRELPTWETSAGDPHPDRLRGSLHVLSNIWHHENKRTDGDILGGLDNFLVLYPDSDRSHLIKSLDQQTPYLILNRMRLGATGMFSRRIMVAAVIYAVYSRDLRKKLPNRFPSRIKVHEL